MTQHVTTGYLAVRFKTTPARILKALQDFGVEPSLILNDQVYWPGDQANIAGLSLTCPGGEIHLRPTSTGESQNV